jgi:hypothetical protein
MAVLQDYKEDQLHVEPNCYGKESPILVNLVPVWNRSKNKMWNLEICG